MKLTLINLILFKIAWLSVVFGAANQLALAGTAVVVLVSLWHLHVARDARSELVLLLVAAGTGLIWESLLISQNVVQYGSAQPLMPIAPYWIVAMWVLFATTLNLGMRWIRRNLTVAMIFGAVGGPLSFLAGQRIGAVSFPDPSLSLVVIGAGWAVLLPAMVIVARRFDGHGTRPMGTQSEYST